MQTMIACLAIAALSFVPLAAKRPEPVVQMEQSQVVINIDATATCTEGACSRACRDYVNNVWCFAGISYCRASDNSCVCQPVCMLKGQKPHVEMTPLSCEDAADACWE